MPELLIEIRPQLESTHPTPVRIEVPRSAAPGSGPLALRPEAGGALVPAQWDEEALVAVVPGFGHGEGPRRYRLVDAPGVQQGGVKLKEESPTRLSILLPEGVFTTYNFDPQYARPFFYPVLSPTGKRLTRSFPMENVPGETKDHPHHRSFWTAYGEVNGVDDWSEEKNHGFIRHQKFLKRQEGNAFGGFTASALWTGPDG
ncbi:MAG TPA: DUF6807 family protein, partial [Armatimonadota bacterium]|nr:DUF6807 family protein [Armatimonadota bacterium]